MKSVATTINIKAHVLLSHNVVDNQYDIIKLRKAIADKVSSEIRWDSLGNGIKDDISDYILAIVQAECMLEIYMETYRINKILIPYEIFIQLN